MLRRAVLLVLLAACLFALPPLSAAAQVGAASLIGQVIDETAASPLAAPEVQAPPFPAL